MIKITFPDGSVREYNEGVNGLQIAESISSRLAQDVLACGVNGETYDLGRPINEDADFVLYKWDDEEGKHAFWHTSAHLLAEALQELYPGIQFGIGPAKVPAKLPPANVHLYAKTHVYPLHHPIYKEQN